jgi:D-amino-acid dehydrogenase
VTATPSSPRHVVVVGAGIVGLSTAWHIQEQGAEVSVYERGEVGLGASWGNAGWLSPGLATPLPEPSVLRLGIKSMFDSHSPLYVPPRVDPGLWRFLLRFATFCTQRHWDQAMKSYIPINALALEAYDELTDSGVKSPTHAQTILAAYEHAEQARPLFHEVEQLAQFGETLRVRELSSLEARQLEPTISPSANYVVGIEDQRYLDPGEFVHALADAVRTRGGKISTGVSVTAVASSRNGVEVRTDGNDFNCDAVVIATGTWLGELVSRAGVNTRVRAGRGYSFTVPTEHPVSAPIYLPAKRIACTPYRSGLRIGGTMEFLPASAPINNVRVNNLIEASRPMLEGVRWDEMTDAWVGPRPVSADGMPLIGSTNADNIFVAGGHGMWGITLGPITGKLLAQLIVTGKRSPVLEPFDPLR